MTFLWQLFDQSLWLTVLNGLGGTARAVSGPRVREWGGWSWRLEYAPNDIQLEAERMVPRNQNGCYQPRC